MGPVTPQYLEGFTSKCAEMEIDPTELVDATDDIEHQAKVAGIADTILKGLGRAKSLVTGSKAKALKGIVGNRQTALDAKAMGRLTPIGHNNSRAAQSLGRWQGKATDEVGKVLKTRIGLGGAGAVGAGMMLNDDDAAAQNPYYM